MLLWEAAAVAGAAMASGVARIALDLEEYKEQLERRLGKSREVMRVVLNQARRAPKRVVFPEGEEEKILRAAQILLDDGLAQPVLVGDERRIRARIAELDLHLERAAVVDPATSERAEPYARALWELRRRRGVTLGEARRLVLDANVWGALMVRLGDAEALVAGVSQHYPDTIRPALQIIQMRDGASRVAGLYMMIFKDKVLFFADTTVNIDPTAEELAEIALGAAEVARRFHVEPRVAMLSFSNFGSARHPQVQRAVEILRRDAPDLVVDGEMQADTALVPEVLEEQYPFSVLRGGANVLVFPSLESANIAYKLVQRLGGAEAIGPIPVGMRRPVHVLARGCEVKDVVHMAAIAVVDSQEAEAAAATLETTSAPRAAAPEPALAPAV